MHFLSLDTQITITLIFKHDFFLISMFLFIDSYSVQQNCNNESYVSKENVIEYNEIKIIGSYKAPRVTIMHSGGAYRYYIFFTRLNDFN
jgi:hypothetical protein